jgi:Ca2+-transporting ATPase
MERAPYEPGESVLSRGIARQIVWIGALMGLVSLGVGYWAWSVENGAWQTMIFTTLTLAQMGNALAIRSSRESLFKIGFGSNRFMLWAVVLTFVLQMAVIYVPFMQGLFNTQPLTALELGISLVFSTVVFWAVEMEKWIIRRRSPNEA